MIYTTENNLKQRTEKDGNGFNARELHVPGFHLNT